MSVCAIQLSKRYGGLQEKTTWFCSHGVWWDCDQTPTRCPVAAALNEGAAQEREACAQLAEELDGVGGEPIIPYSFTDLAADIRARSPCEPKCTCPNLAMHHEDGGCPVHYALDQRKP